MNIAVKKSIKILVLKISTPTGQSWKLKFLYLYSPNLA